MSCNNDHRPVAVINKRDEVLSVFANRSTKNKPKNQRLDVGYSIQVCQVKVIVLMLSTSIQPKSGGKYAQPRNCPQI